MQYTVSDVSVSCSLLVHFNELIAVVKRSSPKRRIFEHVVTGHSRFPGASLYYVRRRERRSQFSLDRFHFRQWDALNFTTHGPHEKSVMHGHPALIGVCLNDAKARFKYVDGKTEEITKAACQVIHFGAVEHDVRRTWVTDRSRLKRRVEGLTFHTFRFRAHLPNTCRFRAPKTGAEYKKSTARCVARAVSVQPSQGQCPPKPFFSILPSPKVYLFGTSQRKRSRKSWLLLSRE